MVMSKSEQHRMFLRCDTSSCKYTDKHAKYTALPLHFPSQFTFDHVIHQHAKTHIRVTLATISLPHSFARRYINTQTRTQTHAHTFAHTHIHTQTHTQVNTLTYMAAFTELCAVNRAKENQNTRKSNRKKDRSLCSNFSYAVNKQIEMTRNKICSYRL